MEEEIKYLKRNHICTLDDLPKYHKLVGCKWVFKKEEETLDVEK